VIERAKLDKEQQGNMLFEFQLLKKIDHPHIIRIFEVFSDEKHICLITEYCQGGDVFGMIQKTEVFNEKIAARILQEVVSAVYYCHTQGIVHRDIKSDNILFLYDSIDSPVKLIDFGISVKYDRNKKLTDKTGSVLYIAPEVIRGSYDEKCDIWSCGVLLYMMLSGAPPFHGETRKDVLAMILKGTVSFKQNIWSMISPEVQDLIRKLLTMNPAQRPGPLEVLSHKWFAHNKYEHSINTAKYLENMKGYDVGQDLSSGSFSADAGDPDVHHNEHHPLRRDQGPAEPVPNTRQRYGWDAQQGGTGYRYLGIYEAFEQVCPHLDEAAVRAMVEDIFEHTDVNGNGKILYSEYLVSAIQRERIITKEILDQAFRSFDLNGDGYITQLEWEQVFGGLKMTKTEWALFLNEIDSDTDGKVSYSEFFDFFQRFEL
jgi:calcium-dependent protein kinase